MKKHVIKGLLISSVVAVSGQASAHVVYGAPLIDQLGAATGNTMALAAYAQTANPNQTTTVASNGGFEATHNATTWGNSHDDKFLWFSVSAPSTVSFTINGLANTNYVNSPFGATNPTTGAALHFSTNPITGAAYSIDTLQPAFNLFSGAVPFLSHDGAYQAANTGFAPWSSWAWEALPTSAGGSAVEGDSNPVYGQSYTVPNTTNFPAGTVIPAGTTSHWGVVGSNNGLVPGDTVLMSDSVTQTTNSDGTPLTNHQGSLTLIGDAAVNDNGSTQSAGPVTVSSTGINNLTASVNLPAAGIYTLQINGANSSDYTAMLADAILTGMNGGEGYKNNTIGLNVQPNTDQQYYNTVTGLFTNSFVDSTTTVANDGSHAGSTGYTGPWGTPVVGFSVPATAGHTFSGTGVDTSPGSAYANTWLAVENWQAVDRGNRSFSIALNGVTPSAVPVPAAVWLFLSGFMGLLGFSKRRNRLVA